MQFGLGTRTSHLLRRADHGVLAACCALIAALLAPVAGRAETESLSKARALYTDMHYDEAYRAYRDALAARGNRPADMVEIYQHLGALAALLNRPDEATDHFLRMLCLNPDAQIPEDMPPKVQQPYAAAKGKSATVTPFRLAHTPVNQLSAHGSLEVEVELTPDTLGMANGINLRYRALGQPVFSAVRKEGTGRLFFSISPSELPPDRDVEYFWQIEDSYGGVLWESGSERTPFLARSPKSAAGTDVGGAGGPGKGAGPEDSPFYTQIWFFVAAGAAVAVAAGATAFAVIWYATTPTSADFEPIAQEIGHQ
jgi:hypothetical protein